MVYASRRLLSHLPHLNRPQSPFGACSPANYNVGLSYAGKNSPPFVRTTEAPQYGFANLRDSNGFVPKVTAFVEDTLSRRAGRGVLKEAAVGGWEDRMALETRRWGAGEDFFCIGDREWTANDYAIPQHSRHLNLAISDGVGGWGDTVDPSLFSQMLMYRYAQFTERKSADHPRARLTLAHNEVMKDKEVPAGSATACAVTIDGEGHLTGVNMGDSGCLILRGGQTIFETVAGTHYFNCPKQLSKIPPGMNQDIARDFVPDEAAADSFSADLIPGDVIVLYTDGLSDNVPATHIPLLHAQITNLLNHPSNTHLTSEERDAEMARLFADVLVGYGRMAMARTGDEPGWKTPFEVEAKKKGYDFKGGKVDDITVITAVVGEQGGDDSPRISAID